MQESHLMTYLSKYFSNGPVGSFEDKTVDLKEHFFDKFGVVVKQEGNLFNFNYDMLAASFAFGVTHECRGTICRYADGKWIRVANTPDKFFNLSEGYCPVFHDADFIKLLPQLSLSRKEDGTLIIVWYDTEKETWRASTRGCITPFKIGDYDITFDALFWKLFGDMSKLDTIGRNHTICFEICSKMNKIVTNYRTDRLYLLTIRDNEYGQYVPPELYNDSLGVALPEKIMLYSLDIKNKEELAQWVESNCQDDEESQYKEGFVLYQGYKSIGKSKTQKYTFLHGFSSGDVGCSLNRSIEAFFCGTVDDVWGVLPDIAKETIEKLKVKVASIQKEVALLIDQMASLEFPTQKDYALYVIKHISDKRLQGFFFQKKDAILAKSINVEDFSFWLKNNWNKFEWKKELP